jgi:hypothetical protein
MISAIFPFRGLIEGLIGPSIGFYAPLLFLRHGLKRSSGGSDQRTYPLLKGVARAELEALAAVTSFALLFIYLERLA